MSAIERDDVDPGTGEDDPELRWVSTIRHPTQASLPGYVDKYFLRTKDCVARFGDKRVTYAVFMRRPVTCAPRLVVPGDQLIQQRLGSLQSCHGCTASWGPLLTG